MFSIRAACSSPLPLAAVLLSYPATGDRTSGNAGGVTKGPSRSKKRVPLLERTLAILVQVGSRVGKGRSDKRMTNTPVYFPSVCCCTTVLPTQGGTFSNFFIIGDSLCFFACHRS